jgi:hypothetical protein
MKKFCSDLSKLIVIPEKPTKKIKNEHINPPITGAGIKNFLRNSTRLLINVPSKKTKPAIPAVCITSKVNVIIIFPNI